MFIVSFTFILYIYYPAFGSSSPSFSLQGINDYYNDTEAYCNQSIADIVYNTSSSVTDIAAVGYHSDGSKLDARFWFNHELQDPQNLNKHLLKNGVSLLKRTYSLLVDIDSTYDIGQLYQLHIHWDKGDKTWKKILWELPPPNDRNIQKKIITINDNFTNFVIGQSYLDLSLDLTEITSPKEYAVLAHSTDEFEIKIGDSVFGGDYKRCIFKDITNVMSIPIPVFQVSVNPSTILMRAGDQTSAEIFIRNNNTIENSYILLNVSNVSGIRFKVDPNNMSLPSQGASRALLNIETDKSLIPGPRTITLNTDISLRPNITIISENLDSSKEIYPVDIVKNNDFTLEILPPLSFNDRLKEIFEWTDPLLATLVAIITIMSGILGWKFWDKQKKDDK